MRKSILGALTVLAVGGISTSVLMANAQPAPPPANLDDASPAHHPHWMGRMMQARHRRDMGEQGSVAPGTFALVHRQQDRQLAPADVQKIAEGFLLWNGNHSWKVVEVAPASDGAIGFALATQEGTVIARFTMDPHSGRVTRTG
jgi:hypothetical protein